MNLDNELAEFRQRGLALVNADPAALALARAAEGLRFGYDHSLGPGVFAQGRDAAIRRIAAAAGTGPKPLIDEAQAIVARARRTTPSVPTTGAKIRANTTGRGELGA